MKNKLIYSILMLSIFNLNSSEANIDQKQIEEYEKEFVVEGRIIIDRQYARERLVIRTTNGEQFSPMKGRWPFDNVRAGLKGKFTIKKDHNVGTCADSKSLPVHVIRFEECEIDDWCTIL